MDKIYDYKFREQKSRELWEATKVYSFKPDSKEKVFSIDTPPPTVSGSLHIGHIFSYTQTDVIARFRRMQGHNVFYPMGFDDNGLPTKLYVEKKRKISAGKMERAEFLKISKEEIAKAHESFRALWTKMGLSIDWSRVYSTISDSVKEISQRFFLELYRDDLVYRKSEPAIYCTACRTSVAQAELEAVELPSTFNTIKFKLSGSDQNLLIATTRPEMLPACVSVFFHPEDSRYENLKNKNAVTPVFGKEVPIIPDESVDREKGTGLVMCCTFGDQTDVMWYKNHKLPLVSVIDHAGRMKSSAGSLEGLKVAEARKKVIELLKKSGDLVEQKEIVHNVNTHERCKKPVEFVEITQWFSKILANKKKFLDLADEISWKPEFMKHRYIDWVENLAWDWCLSRQLPSGIPFPAWHCESCGNVLLASIENLPVDPREEKFNGICKKCGGTTIVPDTDVMDTWATSALTPQINKELLGEGKIEIPMSMRPQAHDIIRTWAFYTIVRAHYHQKTIPWKEIVISGHALAERGSKISKSKSNAKIEPEALLEQYPADAIRYWAASGKLGTDIFFSPEQLKIAQRLITKIWNAFRFSEPYALKPERKIEPREEDILNKWLLNNFRNLLSEYIKEFEKYDYHRSLELVEKFFWNDFCDNYLEMVKPIFFKPEEYDEDFVRASQETLYEVSVGILKLFSPFVPHLTESIFYEVFAEREGIASINGSKYEPERYENFLWKEETKTMSSVVDIVGAIRKLKSEHHLSLKTPIKKISLSSNFSFPFACAESAKKIILGVSNADEVVFEDGISGDELKQDESGLWCIKISKEQA